MFYPPLSVFHPWSPCFFPDRRDRTKQPNVSRVWFSFWSANELIEPSEHLSSLYRQTPLDYPPSASIYPLISNRGNNVSRQHSHLGPLRWRQAATQAQQPRAPVWAVVYTRPLWHSLRFNFLTSTASRSLWSTKLKAAVVIKGGGRLTAQFMKSVRNFLTLF